MGRPAQQEFRHAIDEHSLEGSATMTHPRKKVFYAEGGQVHKSPIPQGVIAGGFIFLSAIRGVDPKTQSIETDDPEKQARQVFENASAALASAGATLADVVKVAVYLQDINDRGAFNKAWAAYFREEPPARFAVQVVNMGASGDKSRILVDVTALAPA